MKPKPFYFSVKLSNDTCNSPDFIWRQVTDRITINVNLYSKKSVS